MRPLLFCVCVLVLGIVAMLGHSQKEPSPDARARAAILKLYKSLNDEQKKAALQKADDKDRYNETFPATRRPGISFDKLTAEQKAMVADVVKATCSEYGARRCLEIAKQDGDGQRYVTFFGEPTEKGRFSWRFAQHHLTLVHIEFGEDRPDEFGPILLGGNPVKDLWDEEEKILLELYGALSADDARAIKGKGGAGSGSAIAKDAVKIANLSENPQKLARSLVAKRLEVFSPDRRKIMEDLIKKEGGVEALRIAIWGEATKSHKDGGNYHWKIGAGTVLLDWQTAGKNHIHMTLRGRAKG
jgi:hypothetical protein